MRMFCRGVEVTPKKILSLQLIACLAIMLSQGISSGAGTGGQPPAETRHAQKKRLLLLAKNPSSWKIVKGGPKGSMTYLESTGEFAFSAAGLPPRSGYALVRYADAPPAVELLARGVTDHQGKLELRGGWRNWTRKFWLVSGEDVEGRGSAAKLVNWRPHRYLFEEKQLGVACACPDPDVP